MNQFMCQCKDTIKQLIEILDDARIAYVRGTPTSGKSALVMLLAERLIEHGRKAVLLRSWPSSISGDNYKELLAQCAFKTQHLILDHNKLRNYDVVFIIDEEVIHFANKPTASRISQLPVSASWAMN